MKRQERFVSVIVPLQYDLEEIGDFITSMSEILKSHYTYHEIILVDLGVKVELKMQIHALLKDVDCIRYYQLSPRRYDLKVGFDVGLEMAIGDIMVTIEPLSDVPAVIPDIVAKTVQYGGIVFGKRKDRKGQPPLVKLGAWVFNQYCRWFLKYDLPKNTTSLHGITRDAVNTLLRIKEPYRNLRMFQSYTGIESHEYVYEPKAQRKWSLFHEIYLALTLVFSHSLHPLRFVSLLAIAAMLVNMGYLAYIIYIYLTLPDVSPGWTTLSLQVGGLFLLVFMILIIFSEYLGRLYRQVKNEPLYCIMKESNSSVLLDSAERRNIVNT